MHGKLVELQRELDAVMTLQDMSDTVIDRLQRLVGASGVTLFSFDEHGRVSTQGGSLTDAMLSYTTDLFPRDAMQQWVLPLPESTFLSDGGRCPEGSAFGFSAHARTRLDAAIHRPLDIAYVIGISPTGLPYGSPHMFGLLLTRPHRLPPFAQHEMDELRFLEVPFRLAARRIAQFRALEQRTDMLGQLPALQAGALALWDAEGRMVWASDKALRRFESHLRRSDLERAAALARLQLRPRRRAGGASFARTRRLRSMGGPAMLVTFSAIAGPDHHSWLLAEIEIAPKATSPVDQLTAAETRVFRLLARGLSNAEMSAQLRISKETVKSHLKRIFFKLRVNSRTRAAYLAAEVWPAHLRPEGEGEEKGA